MPDAKPTTKPQPEPDPVMKSPRSLFVISPIGSAKTADHVRYRKALDFVIKKAFPEPGWKVVRADDEVTPDSITTQVIERIYESELIVADLTDHNPNVFYELAVAHGYKKRVIHIMAEGQKPPFDLSDQRMIFYDLEDVESVYKAQDQLRQAVAALDADPEKQMRNPLTAYERFEKIATASGDDQGGEAIADALESLSRQVARIEQEIRRPGGVKNRAVHRDVYGWTAKSKSAESPTGLGIDFLALARSEIERGSRLTIIRDLGRVTAEIDDLERRQRDGEDVQDALADARLEYEGLSDALRLHNDD